jgi:ATP-dependent helicase/nuclease subunit B
MLLAIAGIRGRFIHPPRPINLVEKQGLIFQSHRAYNREMGEDLLPVEVAEALEHGVTVVTGNQRAARTLRREFDRRNRRLGFESWHPPAVLAWDAWTASLWHALLIDGHASQLLLNQTQEHTVWQEILSADGELTSLRTIDSLAEMAAQAWSLLCSYEGQERLRRTAVSTDSRAFQRWAFAFEKRCREEGLLSQAQLERTLSAAVAAGKAEFGAAGVALVGFDAMTPAQAALMQALRTSGVPVEEIQLATPVAQRTLVGTADETEEFSAAARWIRAFLKEQPLARVAVIVPALEAQRSEIDRVFREVLAPELLDIQARDATGPYEFSLGVPLARTPLVVVALSLLRWATESLSIEQVSGILLSPYLCMRSKEWGSRAEFDAFELRAKRMLRPEVSLDWLSTVLDRSERRQTLGRLPDALRSMRRVVATRLNPADKRSYVEWAERMRELLEAAGWGASESEDSVEFQTRQRWESALDELATLDFDGARIGYAHALQALDRIVRQTIFAPESREAPVQIMGPLEAAGATFDAVWFLRAGDLTWPVASGGSPLLSWQMQKELGIPGTDVTQDTEAARRMTQRIAESAPMAIFSYAKESAEGKQRPSPVLKDLGLEDVEISHLLTPEPERSIVQIEEINDTVRVQALPDHVIHGGARILELQAACGFRAFAEQRLWATELESVELGMDARESGTVVHRVLQYFWNEVATQTALQAMSIEERTTLLDACIVRALHQTAKLSSTAWDEAYLDMQHNRLRRLLDSWLELELERSPFTVKLSEKEFADVHVGPLRLNVRMDRVDVIDGGEILIDYKTGAASPNDWLTDRPDAPQLPLYAILSEAEHLQGVAFALVRAGEGRGLKGYAVGSGILPKPARLKAPSLEAQVDDWRRVLVNLATEFASGDARVSPKKYPTTCERCAQRMLCRLDVSLLEDDDEDDMGSPAEAYRG